MSGYMTGDSHSANGSPSRLHSKVASMSVALKVNTALFSLVGDLGAVVMVVSGGTATVQSYSSGVSSTSPNRPLATTSNV